MFECLADEWGRPPWLWPSPSLRLLTRPPTDYQPIVVRYAPGVAARYAVTPARHYGPDPGDAPARAPGPGQALTERAPVGLAAGRGITLGGAARQA